MSKSVLIIGATGLVGNLTLRKLLHNESFHEVKAIVRRSTGIQHENLNELITDFELLDDHKTFMNCDVLISCLGSTIKKAGSKANFERFDYYYPLRIAEFCKEKGATEMVLLSALGANADSMIFYNRIKGRLENECRKIQFNKLTILRPSLIVGDRNEKRTGEGFAKAFMNLIKPLVPLKYQAVEAEVLAQTILNYALNPGEEIVQIITRINFAG